MRDGWIRDDSGTEYEIVLVKQPAGGKPSFADYKLGGGAEGIVFKVRENGGNNFWIFKSINEYDKRKQKLYKVRDFHDQKHLVFDSVSSDFSVGYTWPMSHVNSGFTLLGKKLSGGYIMKLQNLKNTLTSDDIRVNADQNGDELSLDYFTLCDFGIKLCRAMEAFHDSGYCYKDVSRDNIRFRLNTTGSDKSIIIIDPDNIGVSGGNEPSDVKGTPGFMAPEVASGLASPSVKSDCFAIAIMLFALFIKGDPFESGLEDANGHAIEWDTYKKNNPVFIFHPTNKSNSLFGHDEKLEYYSWRAAPKKIKDCFTKTFVDGVSNPGMRPSMGEWIRTLSDVKFNGLKYCPSCGKTMARDGSHCLVCGEDNLNYDSSKPAILFHSESFSGKYDWKVTHDMFVAGNRVISGEKLSPMLNKHPAIFGFSYREYKGQKEYFLINKSTIPMSLVMICGDKTETLGPGKMVMIKHVQKVWIMNDIQVTFGICKE